MNLKKTMVMFKVDNWINTVKSNIGKAKDYIHYGQNITFSRKNQ